MTRYALGVALLATTLLATACAGPDSGCADNDPTCFTHAAGNANDGTDTTQEGTQGSVTTTTGGASTTTTGGTTTGGTNTTTTGGGTSTTTTGGSTAGTITKTLVVDDFANQTTFNAGQNSLSPPQLQSDNQTMAVYALASNNRLELQCNVSGCFWYSLLAQQGACLDITAYTHIALTVQGAPGADASFQLQNNSADCTSTTFTNAQNVDLATYAPFDNSPHSVFIPLTAFGGVDKVHSRAIAVLNLTLNTPIYLSNIKLVTMTPAK